MIVLQQGIVSTQHVTRLRRQVDEEVLSRSGESGHRDSTWVGQARDAGALLPTIKLLQRSSSQNPAPFPATLSLTAFCTALGEGS